MKTIAIIVLSFAAQACSALSAKTGPGTDYPCGVGGVVCSHAMCCDEGSVCGGDDPTCPAGQCCFVGSDSLDAKQDKLQTPAGR